MVPSALPAGVEDAVSHASNLTVSCVLTRDIKLYFIAFLNIKVLLAVFFCIRHLSPFNSNVALNL